MPAYIIADIVVTDPEAYAAYRSLTPDAIAKNGGRVIVRGGETATLEGDWTPNRLVVLEFPDMAAAKAFYDSPEYCKAREVRKDAAVFKMIVTEGV